MKVRPEAPDRIFLSDPAGLNMAMLEYQGSWGTSEWYDQDDQLRVEHGVTWRLYLCSASEIWVEGVSGAYSHEKGMTETRDAVIEWAQRRLQTLQRQEPAPETQS